MISIYINDRLVDIEDNLSLTLTKEYINNNVLEQSEEVYFSYDIDLPITSTNKEIFNHIDSFDVARKFNQLFTARVYNNDMLIMDGYFYIQEMSNEYITGNLYQPSVTQLGDVLSDRALNELNIVAVDLKTLADINVVNETNNFVKFPYVLYNYPYNNPLGGYLNDEQSLGTDNTIKLDNIFPVYNVTEMIKHIFTSHNLNIDGNIFDDERFKNLYQTLSVDSEDYTSSVNPNYYLNFDFKYQNYGLDGDRDLTTEVILEDGFDKFATVRSSLFLVGDSCTELSNIIDENSLLTTAPTEDGDNGYVLSIKDSGWYYVKMNTNLLLNRARYSSSTGNWKNADPTKHPIWGYLKGVYYGMNWDIDTSWRTWDGEWPNTGATYNAELNSTFANNIYEFQLVKGVSPHKNTTLYARNFSEPYNVVSDELSIKTLPDGQYIDVYGNMSNASRRFPFNESAMPLNNDSNFNIDNLILSQRWGATRSEGRIISNGNERYYNNWDDKINLFNLPNPINFTFDDYKPTTASEQTSMNVSALESFGFLYEHINSDVNNKASVERYIEGNHYSWKTAQAVFKGDDIMNVGGYNVLTYDTLNGDIIREWITEAAETYDGLPNSRVWVEDEPGVHEYRGSRGLGETYMLTWLEAGDLLNLVLVQGALGKITPFEEYSATALTVTGNFEMVYVSSDREYDFKTKGVKTFDEYKNNSGTNFTNFFGDETCNDYLNNLINTFNLKLTQKNFNSYELNSLYNTNFVNNIIPIDDFVHEKQAKFKKIDIVSTIKLEWTNDYEEEGYRSQPEDGMGILVNPTNTTKDEDNRISKYSYCWYKPIKFGNTNIKYIPVINPSEMWIRSATYSEALEEGYTTDLTSRLMYLSDDNVSLQCLEADGSEITLKLPIPKNSTTLVNGSEFNLDFNMKPNIGESTIGSTFFEISDINEYELEIDLILPNTIFVQLSTNSLISFNGNLFKLKSVEGFDPTERTECTLTLISV